MVEPQTLICTVRERRRAHGLSQAELAARVGVSRQALIQIESGRQTPSTALALALARALRCAVEDLFRLSGGGVIEARVTAPDGSARVAVGQVDGTWVAHAVDEAQAADGVVVGPGTVELFDSAGRVEENVLVAGCAPLLGMLTGRVSRAALGARATWIGANSERALELLVSGAVHIAGIHLAAPSHADLVVQAFPGARVAIVNLTRWTQGLVVAPGNPRGVSAIADVLRPDVRLVRREPGAGAQRLLEAEVARLEPAAGWLDGAPQAQSHAEVARMIRWGIADVGVAIESVARAEGLDFIPLVDERFDLVLPQSRLDARPVARLLELVGSATFRADASRLAGHDPSAAGDLCIVGGEP